MGQNNETPAKCQKQDKIEEMARIIEHNRQLIKKERKRAEEAEEREKKAKEALKDGGLCNKKVLVVVLPVLIIFVAVIWQYVESCNDGWISPNEPNFYYNLTNRIYGQHLAKEIIFKAIRGHLSNKTPKKALALSFNGMTGTGKNHASRVITQSIYRKGFASKYVKLMIGSHDFKHRHQLEKNKIKLKNWITDTVSRCPRSLFIFDEVEKISSELVDVLKPFLSHYEQVDGVDYRKAIFIFMGNTGADLINQETILNHQQGKRREDITIKQMDKVLSTGALRKVGGFLHSTLLEHQLIEYFIPFLPLEKSHVIKCIEDDLREKKALSTDNIVQKVLSELNYFPRDSQLFSESGCKKVSSKVDQYLG